MSSKFPVRPKSRCENFCDEEKRGRVIEANEEEEESMATKRKNGEGDDEVAAKVRRAEKSEALPREADADEEEEARKVKAPPVPPTPSREEVANHRLTHRPVNLTVVHHLVHPTQVSSLTQFC